MMTANKWELDSNFSNYQPVSSAEISKKDIFNHNFVKIRPDPQIMEKLKTGSNKDISNNIEIINENSEVSQLTIRKILSYKKSSEY